MESDLARLLAPLPLGPPPQAHRSRRPINALAAHRLVAAEVWHAAVAGCTPEDATALALEVVRRPLAPAPFAAADWRRRARPPHPPPPSAADPSWLERRGRSRHSLCRCACPNLMNFHLGLTVSARPCRQMASPHTCLRNELAQKSSVDPCSGVACRLDAARSADRAFSAARLQLAALCALTLTRCFSQCTDVHRLM